MRGIVYLKLGWGEGLSTSDVAWGFPSPNPSRLREGSKKSILSPYIAQSSPPAGGRGWGRAGREGRNLGNYDPATPNCDSMNACHSAFCRIRSNRPDLPPCPASMFTRKTSGLTSVFLARNRATHFAGS